jgi:hypothetical protein
LLHLNYSKSSEAWKVGQYLFVIYKDVAFEVFNAGTSELRIIRNFNIKKLKNLSLDVKSGIENNYKRYIDKFNT